MVKKLIATGLAAGAIMTAALPAFAHRALTFDPVEPNCMGMITSFHAKDPSKGLRHNAEGMRHRGIANALGEDPADNFQEFMSLSQMWCMSE